MFYSTTYSSPIGMITLASDGEKLVGLWMEGQKYYGGALLNELVENSDIPVFEETKKWLDKYFAGEKPAISDLPISPIGSDPVAEITIAQKPMPDISEFLKR